MTSDGGHASTLDVGRADTISRAADPSARAHVFVASIGPSGLSDLAPRWQDLERDAPANPFLTFAWMDAWWRAFGQEDDPYVVLVEDGEGRTVGLAPLMRHVTHTRFGGKLVTLRFMGDPGSDRLGFVSRRGHEREVAGAVADWLRRRRDWHVISLSNMVDGCEELGALARCFGGGHLVIGQPGLACPFLTIEGDWDQFLQGRTANFRSELRRTRRKVENAAGGRFRTCSEPDDVRRALDFLFRHSIERLEDGTGSSFSDPRFQAFHVDAAMRLLQLGRLSLWVLEMEGTPAAVLYNLLEGDTVWFYNAAFDARWGAFKPGAVLLGRAIEEAFAQGAREFDFLLGDYPYKRRWASGARQHRTLTVVRPRPNAILDAAVPRWWDLAKDGVKRSAPPGVSALLGRLARSLGGGGRHR